MVKLKHEAELGRSNPGQVASIQMIDPPSGYLHGSGIGAIECSKNVQQGALPRPGGSYDSQNCATRNLEIGALENLKRALWCAV